MSKNVCTIGKLLMGENKKIWFVTTNKQKFLETQGFCHSKNLNVELSQDETPLFEVQTRDPKDIRTVALHKSKQAWDKVGDPVLIEYTGIFLHKYGNFPGSLTKHVFKGIGYRGLFRLVDSGDGVSFVSVLVYVDEYGNANLFEGRQEGIIIKPEKLEINAEHPFDQLFIPDDFNQTYDELRKNVDTKFEHASYRHVAISKFIQHLKKNNH